MEEKNPESFINKFIEERFGSEPVYQQTRAMLEGRAKQMEAKALINDSRAMFAGNNKPEVLFVAAVEQIQNKLAQNADVLKNAIVENQKKVRENVVEAIRAMKEFTIPKEGEASTHEAEVKNASVVRAMTEATKSGIELKQYRVGLDKSTGSMMAVLDNIKASMIKRV